MCALRRGGREDGLPGQSSRPSFPGLCYNLDFPTCALTGLLIFLSISVLPVFPAPTPTHTHAHERREGRIKARVVILFLVFQELGKNGLKPAQTLLTVGRFLIIMGQWWE